MAAIAVLAVAFAVFAAIPAVVDDSDATSAESITADQFLGLAKDGKIVLDKDYILTNTVRVASDLEIDLAGHTVTADVSKGNMFLVKPTTEDAVELKITNGKLVGTRGGGSDWYTVVDGSAFKTSAVKDGERTTTYTYTLVRGCSIVLTDVDVDSQSYGVGVSGEYLRAQEVYGTDGKEKSHTDVVDPIRNKVWEDKDAVITLTVNGGTISGGNGASAVGTNGMFGGELITINGATLKSEEGSAIYAPSNAHWYVSGGTIEGISGIDVRAGNVTVSGSTIKYNGPAEDKDGGDGPVAFGVGVSVMPVYGYSPAGTNVIIEDSVTFEKGDNATDQLFVSSFKYNSNASVSYEDMKAQTGKIASNTFVQCKGFQIQYAQDTSNTAAAGATVIGFADGKVDLSVGAKATVTVTENATGKVDNKGVLNVAAGKTLDASADGAYTNTGIIYLGANSKLKYKDEASAGTIYAGKDAKINDNPIGEHAKAIISSDDSAKLDEVLKGNVENVNVDANVNVSEDLVVPAGTTLTVNGSNAITLENGKNMAVAGEFSGKIVGKAANGTETVAIISGLSGYTLTAGSIEVTGASFADGKIEVISGDIVISGNIDGKIEIITTDQTGAATVTFKGVNINSNGQLILSKKDGVTINYVVEDSMNLYGSLTSASVVELTVNKPSDTTKTNKFTAYSGSKMSGMTVTGTGDINLTLAQKDFEIGQDISSNKNFGQLENVVVIGTLTIGNNATVTVAGGFQINEGVTLTIESGATLKIESDVAAVNIAGNIIVEDGAHFIVEKSKSVTVSGTVESDGEVLVKSNVTIKSGGKILINEGETEENATGIVTKYNSTIEVKGGLTVEADAVLEVHSQMKIKGIENKGTVTFAGAVLVNDSEITLAASNASVVITSVINKNSETHKLAITDSKLKFTNTLSVDGTYAKANKIEITPGTYSVSGLTVVETVKTSVDATGTTVYKNYMDFSGSIVATKVTGVTATGTADVSVPGGRITVEGKLDLGNDVKFTVAGESTLDVAGTIAGALAVSGTTSAAKAVIINNGIITVTGLIQIQDGITGGKINAAMYETTTGTTKVANYTTLKAAIESGAKTITVTGTVDVTESLTVPKDVTIKATNDTMINVGSTEKTEADRAVVLTFADGAIANGGKYNVVGTLVFENKKNDKAEKISDVAVIDEKSSKYTNIYTAIKGAKAGEVISIYSGRVVLDASLTIPADVTVDVPSGKILSLDKGVTLTVVGTLKTASKLETEAGVSFATKASTKTGEYAAAIIVSGKLMSQVAFGYSDYKISGAYFQLTDTAGDYCYVTPVEYAATVADKVVNATVSIYGTVTAGDVAFTGTSTVTVHVKGMIDSTITVASITLTAADLDFDGKSFTGTVKVGDAAIAATKVTALKVNVKDGSEDRLLVENVKFNNAVDKFETAAFSVSAGTVSVKAVDLATKGSLTVAQGATLMSSETELAIPAGVIVFVDGVITVDNGQTVSVEKAEVAGTITVAKETDTKAKGTFQAVNMYVGITAKDVTGTAITGAAVVLSGNVVLGDAPAFAVVAAGSDVDADAVKALGKKTTVYSVEGKDWVTVYAKGNVAINTIETAPVTNALFNNWVNEKGVAIAKNDTTTYVGSDNCAKVTADVKYDIYTISITACAGVESIAIDGNLIGNHASVDVKAGSHTITYSLANGYSGEAKLSLVKAEKTTASVSGQSFTVNGEKGVVELQLTGVEKSGYVDPVVPEQKDDDGMSLTDILLIVLVVLIVIMAVIVAMRLMRS